MKFTKLLVICALGFSISCQPPEDRPNIIIVMCDDSGYSDLGCYGSEIQTPNIDKLANMGLRFVNFYNNGRCSPTRASLMTGNGSGKVGFAAGTLGGYQREMNIPSYRARLPYEVPTIAELMRKAGYTTMMVGKWHLGGSILEGNQQQQKRWKNTHSGWELTQDEMEADFHALPLQRGFDKYFGILEGENNHFITSEDHSTYLEGNEPAKLSFDQTYSMNCVVNKNSPATYKNCEGEISKAFYATDGETDRAIEMIREEHNSKDPFFLYLAYRAPHLPLQAPDELVQKYMSNYKNFPEVEENRVKGLVREGVFPEKAEYKHSYKKGQELKESVHKELQMRYALHAAMMEVIDNNMGKLLMSLEEEGELDNTLIFFFSDNGAASHVGQMMNSPYRGCKALMWEGGVKSHCIAYWKDVIEPNTINESLVWVGDLLPTCVEIAGETYPEEFRGRKTSPIDGINILQALEGKEIPRREYLFSNDKGQQGVIYQGKWKLLIEPGWYLQTAEVPGIKYELYDLENDPAETEDISSSNPELIEKLSEAAKQWQSECGIIDYGEILQMNAGIAR
jgi:arylsulfatase A-like enzyme